MRPRSPAPAPGVLEPLERTLRLWAWGSELAGMWWTRHGAPGAAAAGRARLRALVRFARAASPFHRRLYAGLPDDPPLSALPPVARGALMAAFDDWCTDPRVRRAPVERFLADRRRVGEPFLGRYRLWKSSGSTGEPGIFVQDEPAMAVYDALVAAQFDPSRLDARRLLAGGGRAALVVATGDHFAGIASWEHLRRAFPGLDARSFPVTLPLPRLAAALEAFQPAFVASYPSVLALLAAQARAGRLRIAPALLWSGGESLTAPARAALASAFGCPVMNEYGASECLAIAYGCEAGWLHVNADWVVLEPVDARGRPAAPGERSHTVLVTNLANRVQPIIRYDLGDRVTALGTACACGSPLPAVRVEGRQGAPVALRGARGRPVALAPLALETVLEEALGAERFQLAQVAPDALALRLDRAEGRRADAWRRAERALRAYLDAQALPNVALRLDAAGPRPERASGKLRTLVVEAPWTPKPARR